MDCRQRFFVQKSACSPVSASKAASLTFLLCTLRSTKYEPDTNNNGRGSAEAGLLFGGGQFTGSGLRASWAASVGVSERSDRVFRSA